VAGGLEAVTALGVELDKFSLQVITATARIVSAAAGVMIQMILLL